MRNQIMPDVKRGIVATAPAHAHAGSHSCTGALARSSRRGLSSVLAMIYLVLFGTLAVGFFASVNTAVQISKNDQKSAKALLAAESGLQFMCYHLGEVRIPPRTPPSRMMAELASDLDAQLDGLGRTLRGDPVAYDGADIRIPADPNALIRLDSSGMGFRISLTQTETGDIVCRVAGHYGGSIVTSRHLSVDFIRRVVPTTVFDYAIASTGGIVMRKGSITGVNGVSRDEIATVMSTRPTSPAITVSGGTIGGDISVMDPRLANVSGGSVGGTTSSSAILSQHTHVLDEPEFPQFDTTVFRPFATGSYSGGPILKNVRIPPNTNPKFNNVTIQGILYIESPNTVEFRGSGNLQGFIVFENKGTPAVNVIDQRGNFAHQPLPPGAEFDVLRRITGYAMLAPTAQMVISGSVDSLLRGNVILGRFANGGSADWIIDRGTLLTLDNSHDAAVFNGKTVKFTETGKLNKPNVGVRYNDHFVPDPGTYQEFRP